MLQGRGDVGLTQQEEQLALQGEYSACYETLDLLGKGAFGFVKSARRRADSLAVRGMNVPVGFSLGNVWGMASHIYC